MYKDWCIHFYVKIRAWALCTKTSVYIFMSRLGPGLYVQRLVYTFLCQDEGLGFMYKDWCIHFYVKIRAWALCTKTSVYIFMSRLGPGLYVQRLVYTFLCQDDGLGFMYKDWCIHFYVKIRAWALCTKTGVYIFMSRLGPGLYVQRLVYTF